jgi:hypothetical protein
MSDDVDSLMAADWRETTSVPERRYLEVGRTPFMIPMPLYPAELAADMTRWLCELGKEWIAVR